MEILTKDAIIALQNYELKDSNSTPTTTEVVEEDQVEEEVIVEAELNKCKKCQFTAPNIQILGLHVENIHQGHQFECSDCSQMFPLKNKP